MIWLLLLWAWLGQAKVDAARVPPLKVCTAYTDRAIIYIENGVMNCSDGPLFMGGSPASIGLDDVMIAATPPGSLTVNYLGGPGNAQLCVNPSGQIYRGHPGC